MKWLSRWSITLMVPAFFSLPFPDTTDAYLDPGTGSIIIQVVIGVAVGGLFALKVFWNRIVTFVKKLFSRGESVEKPKE